jgi:crotonobetainyl-CoA:carnitine CoA-transferase CaiB-like acyl-CoA transferase
LRSRLDLHEVGFSPIHDIADVFADPHLRSRQAIVSVPDSELGVVRMQGVVPRFSDSQCCVREAGPALGAHNEEVFASLGFSTEEIDALREKGVI